MEESFTPSAIHVQVRGVEKRYGEHQVLRGVSFHIPRRKVTMLIGASGAGKSVLMRQLIRLERPDAGEILVDGRDIVPLRERELMAVRRKFGMVFQSAALFDSMSVFDNVAFPLREHTRLRRRQVRERVMARLEELGVATAAKRLPAELSGGMRKRVAIARALVLETELLIYDEPTTGLDPLTSRAVDDLIVETQERFGVTSVVISHDMASVLRIADQITFLHQGRIEISTDLGDFMAAPPPAAHELLVASGVTLP
ncbi:MAG: ABC transporter ATP-binding protein [Polyangiales bacterium]